MAGQRSDGASPLAPPPGSSPGQTDSPPGRGSPSAQAVAHASWPAGARWLWLLGLLVVLAAAVVPFAVKGFVLFQLTMAMVYAIAILGLNLLTGISGQFSLGNGAFFAIGAYVAAILMERAGVGHLLTLPAAGLICFIAGTLFGLPAARLEGSALALATFALALTMPPLLKMSVLEHWTGGGQGLVLTKPEAPAGLPLTPDQWLYLLTLAVLAAMMWAAGNLIASRSGRALLAIRENPTAASALGVDVARAKALAFGVSALYTGIAGALGALAVAFVAPDGFTFQLSIALFVGLVVGGVGSIAGCLAGGLFVLFAPNLAEGVSKGLAGALYGVILLAVLFLAPAGVAGVARALVARIGKLGRRRS